MTTQIVMGGYGPPTTTHSRALKIIGERLLQHFGVALDIRYVWNIMDFGYKGEEVLWMSERGLLTLAYQSTSYLTERVPELEFADLPFLFDSLDAARAAMDGAFGAYMSRVIEQGVPNYKMLGYFENGYRHVSNRLRPLRRPEDMQGLSIRSLPSRMHARTYELLGAEPRIMDLKPAIEQISAGRLDAQENPLANTVDYGVHRVHTFHTLTGHSYLSRGIYCHRASFESWPAELQDAMLAAVRAAVILQRELAVREEAIAEQAIINAGGTVIRLTAEERARFVAAVKPLHDEARTRFPDAYAALHG
jgi:TRAP-type C4-dicarboxylate transport system substrate-binding protein